MAGGGGLLGGLIYPDTTLVLLLSLGFGPFRNKSKYELASVYFKNVACALHKPVSADNFQMRYKSAPF